MEEFQIKNCILYKYDIPSSYISNYTLTEVKFIKKGWYPPKNMLDDINSEKECFDTLQEIIDLRKEAFLACNYLNDYDLPYVPYIITKDVLKNEDNLRKFIKENIKEYPFIKTCLLSPKDACSCIFTDVEYAVEIISKGSIRTSDWKKQHLVMKKVRNFIQEYRCYIINDNLRAIVSLKELDINQKYKIQSFLNKYKYNLPHTICIEVGESDEYGMEVIEMNPLGPDMSCGIDPFKWEEDAFLLYSTDTVLYRYLYDHI